MARDERIDAYIAKAAPFAVPILEHLRALVHATIPDADETIKWGMPHFTVGGKNAAGMAAFKAHCAFTLHGEGRQGKDGGMGQFGKITALSDLPPDTVLAENLKLVANRIAETGSPRKTTAPRAPKREIAMPDDFFAALDAVQQARASFDGFPPGARREYLEWITEAKTPATRQRRMAQAVEWIAEGKKRNWKNEKC